MTVSSRREREQQMRQGMILDAASQLFKDKGFEASTVDEIAALAELGKGTIYSYFKSKDQIYVAILKKGLEAFQERMDLIVQNPVSAVAALHQLYDIFIHYHTERSEFAKTLFVLADPQTSIRLGELVRGLKDNAMQWTESVSQLLALGIENGELVTFEVDKMSKLIIGLILGMIMQLEMGQIVGDLSDYRESFFRLTLEGLVKRNFPSDNP
jgi:AcrR family transcriptional regulator